jgi:hypothetical protein
MEAHRVVRHRGSYIFEDIRLTDGGEAVSLMRLPSFTSRKIPDTHFLPACSVVPQPSTLPRAPVKSYMKQRYVGHEMDLLQEF